MGKLSLWIMNVSVIVKVLVKHGLSVPSTRSVLPPPSVAEVILNVATM